MKTKFYTIVFLSILSVVFVPKYVFGAEFLLSGNAKEFHTNDTFQVDLTLDTRGESINAVEGTIIFPQDILELQEIRDGGSIINFWIERPHATGTQVLFSGITPLGYTNKKGFVLSLVFHTKKDGQGSVRLINARVLSNDGSGTEIPSTNSNFQFSVSKINPSSDNQNLQIHDSVPPEIFKPEIVQDKNLLEGQWLVVFATDDKGSGIASYQVKEKKHFFSIPGWHDAQSPYVLTDQNLNSFISVKAIDKSGNERIVTLAPQNPIPFYKNYDNIFILIIVLIAYIYRKKLLRVFKK